MYIYIPLKIALKCFQQWLRYFMNMDGRSQRKIFRWVITKCLNAYMQLKIVSRNIFETPWMRAIFKVASKK